MAAQDVEFGLSGFFSGLLSGLHNECWPIEIRLDAGGCVEVRVHTEWTENNQPCCGWIVVNFFMISQCGLYLCIYIYIICDPIYSADTRPPNTHVLNTYIQVLCGFSTLILVLEHPPLQGKHEFLEGDAACAARDTVTESSGEVLCRQK